jgi:hypothetical protein
MANTPVGRVSFPKVFKPQAFSGGDPKFSITLLFDNEGILKGMKDMASRTAREKWPKGIPSGLRSPFRNGTEYNDRREAEGKDRLEGYDGKTFIRFTSSSRPGVVDPQVRQIAEEDEMLYAGCYAIVSYSCFAYSISGNLGVSFGLNNVQVVGPGDPFSGKPSPEDDFVPISESEFEAPETEESDDSIYA